MLRLTNASKLCAIAFVGVVVPFELHAATDGELGATSTGRINVTMQLLFDDPPPPAEISITGLEDIDLTPLNPFASEEAADPGSVTRVINNICVSILGGETNTYNIEITGMNDPALSLFNTGILWETELNGARAGYRWEYSAGGVTGSTGLPATQNSTCSAGEFAQLAVELTSVSADETGSGGFLRDTLSITVIPQ